MLEVHAPHQPINTWKDVFIHIGIIVVGLCIAVGLDEIVVFFHHRYQIKETREALQVEREKNHKNIETDAKLWRVNVAVLQNNLAVFEYILHHPGIPQEKLPGIIYWNMANQETTHVAWDSAKQNGIVAMMSDIETSRIAMQYQFLKNIEDYETTHLQVVCDANRYSFIDSDPTHLTPQQIAHEIDLTQKALSVDFQIGNEMTNLEAINTDYPSIPTREEVYKLWDSRDELTWKKLENASQITFSRMRAAGYVEPKTGPDDVILEEQTPSEKK